MSSRSVQIIGGADRQHAYVDSKNNALTVQDEIHTKIHNGEFYTVGTAKEIAGDGVADFLIRVVSGAAHVRFLGTVAHNMLASLYERPTTSADGVPLTVFNRNRFSSNTATMLVFVGPTVTDPGTSLIDYFIPAGDKQTASGGTGSSFEEWILNPGDYIVRLSNNIISPAASGYASLILDFYE